MFTERKDVAGAPSARTGRARKAFEAQLDAALGERIRADGACACVIWSALTNVTWHGPAAGSCGIPPAKLVIVAWV